MTILKRLQSSDQHPVPTGLRLLTLAAVLVVLPAHGADLLDLFKSTPAASQPSSASPALTALSESQIASGLKEALGKGVEQAVAALGKPDGFLKDLNVKIPMPESLQKVEKTLRALRQDKLADEFVTTMNRAAEQAVPEAAAVLGESVKQMTIADAQSILTGTNAAATQYFRRTSETNLHARFLPIVKAATEKTGVTGVYKRMTDKVSGGLGGLGGFSGLGGNLLGIQSLDLDDYITRKAMDGLFLKIAEQEKLIRENPVARTTDLLQKVFGAAASGQLTKAFAAKTWPGVQAQIPVFKAETQPKTVQAEPTSNLLQEYGNLIVGRWLGDVTWVADWPGLGKKGDKAVVHLAVRWIADKKGLEDEGVGGQGTGKSIYFFDPSSKKIKQFGIDSGGSTSENEIWKEGNEWIFSGKGYLADGSKCEVTGTISFKDDGNTVAFKSTSSTINGKDTLVQNDVYTRASK